MTFVRIPSVSEVRPLSSTGVTRRRQYYGPVRHPTRPRLTLTGCGLVVTRHHRWGFPCCDWSPCACMLSPIPRRDRWVLTSLASPAMAAFREFWARRLPHYPFRGLLDVHCSLRPACSLNRLAIRLSECFNGCRCLHPPLRGLPAGATFAGRELHPLRTSALSRRTRICGC